MKEKINKIKEMGIGRVEENVSLKEYSTYKAGGIARMVIYPRNTTKLIKLLKYLKSSEIPFKVIGYGSNILFSDKTYEGVLIKLSLMACKKGLTGLEFATGIPGSVGGSVFMNAGAYKSDMGYVVETVKVLTPKYEVINLENKEMDFHYRSSFLQKHRDYICLEVVFKLQKGKKEAIEEVVSERRERRLASQPLEYPSCGSVFRNPPDNFAGKLIEDCGLKGFKKGGAMVSNKHANFIVNYKNAKSSDIKYLIDLCHDTVLKENGIDMKIEQEFVNWE